MSHTEKKHDQYYEMANAPISHIIPKLAAPTIVSMLISSIYNMADTFFVSQLGTQRLRCCRRYLFCHVHYTGTGIYDRNGKRQLYDPFPWCRKKRTGRTDRFYCLFTGIIMGLVITVSATFNIHRVVLLLGATETIAPYAEAYAHYIFIAAPFMICSFIMNNLLRFQGKASFAMVGITVGGLLNIALDPLFIFTLDMGTAGAALATGLSQFISFCILLWMCNHQDSCISISIRKFRPKLAIYREVLYGGIPSLGRQGIASVATILMNFMCQPYGDAAIAAMSIVSRFMFFINSVIIGFGQGFQPVCSYCFGAGLYDRVKKACWFCIRVSTIILLVLSVISFPAARSIITLFRRNDPTVIEIGTLALRLQLITLPLQGAVIMGNMMPQSIGYGFRATLVSTARQGIFLIPLLTIMTYTIGLLGIQCAQPLADIATFILSLFVIRGIFKEFPEDASSFAAQ